MIAFLLSVFLSYAPNAEARCGVGCVRQMGSCTVNQALWDGAAASGYTRTSCCRSPEYNNGLARCGRGYTPQPGGAHTTGNAVDLAIPPHLCNAPHLRSKGFPDVCVKWHNPPHCHVSMCGTRQSYQQSRSAERREIRQIRRHNKRAAYAPARYQQYQYDNPVYSRPNYQQNFDFFRIFFGGGMR